jgi:hypothetical protein
MSFFLVLFWYSAVVYDAGARTVFAVIPRFGEFNSRLGGCKFPVRFTTGIRGLRLDLLHRFCSQTTVGGENQLNSRFDGKRTGNFSPSTVALIAGVFSRRSKANVRPWLSTTMAGYRAQ